jgi:tetratricopeptide (TPR) repeat protein
VSALPRPDVPSGPRRDLVDALHALHHRAGWPSLRVIAGSAGCSHTTVSTLFSSPRLPSWGVLSAVVEAMQGDVEEFRSLWLAVTTPDQPAGGRVARIAGRRDELSALRRHVDRGHGRMLMVAGEAGMGKTRLVDAAAGLVAEDTFVASGTCLPLSGEVPMLPVADVLRSVYEEDVGKWLKEAFAECAPYVARSLGDLVPELEPTPGRSTSDDGGARHRLLVAVESTLSALAAVRPLVLVLEDLHWADSLTLDLLEYLLNRDCGVPLVGTWRLDDPDTPAETNDWYARLRRLPRVQVVSLAPLTRDETAEQLDLLLGPGVHPGVVDRVYRRSHGQPLFTEQLAARPDDEALPGLLGDLLDRRLDRLGGRARTVARALAVADRPLGDALLVDTTGLSSDDLSHGLHELDDRHLLAAPRAHELRLRHPLLAEAVRRRLLPHELGAAHGRVATALARSDDPSPAEVAEHWQRAGDVHEELRWRVRAAQAAGRRFALAQAAAQWRRALDLWPDGLDAVGSPGVRRIEAYLAAMDALEFTDVEAAWTLAQEAMHTLDDPTGLDAAATYRRAAEFRGGLGHHEEGLALVGRALEIYEAAPPSPAYVDALARQEYLLSALGRDAEGAATAARAAEVSAALGDTAVYRTRLSVQAVYDAFAGDLTRALSRIEAAYGIPVTSPDPKGEVYVAVNHTVILLLAAAGPDEVAAAARPGLAAAAQWGLDTWPVSVLRANVATALLRAGQVRRAALLVDPVTDGNPTYLTSPEHSVRATLDLHRGRLASACRRFEALAEIPADSLGNLMEDVESVAEADLWCGRPRAALERLQAVLADAVTTDLSAQLGTVMVLAARAAADLADSLPVTSHRRQQLLAQLDGWLAEATQDPFGPLSAQATRHALAATWLAETTRLAGTSSLERWVAAAQAWDALSRPHDAAYCRWRGAQVAARTGRATTSRRLLTRAGRDAREHAPLSAAISSTLLAPSGAAH